MIRQASIWGLGWLLLSATVALASPMPPVSRSAPAPVARAEAPDVAAPVGAEMEEDNVDVSPDDAEPDQASARGKKRPVKKKSSFDNSRTDINLYNETVSRKDRVKSLFYTPTEVRDIHLAVNTYLKNIGRGGDLTFDEEAFLSRLGGLKKAASSGNAQSRFFTYPQFFLDSLVYYSANDWLVWVNGEKITQATPKESSNIRVTGITPDHVTFEWFPLDMDRVNEIWKRYPNPDVTVDSRRGQVIFSIKPNQTFSSFHMKALEGRVLPVTVDITRSSLPAFPVEKEEQKEETPAATDTPSNEGLTGLINSYQHIKEEEKKQ